MKSFLQCLAIILIFIFPEHVFAQEDVGPLRLRVRKYVFKGGNQYSVNIPDLEFHVIMQKRFKTIQSAVTADYDFQRKDMGFGMSHAFHKYVVNPGVAVEDNLYFRKVFSDSTGIWSRTQSITPFLMHEINDNSTLGLNFKFERQWSPDRREGTDILKFNDNSLKFFYYVQSDLNEKSEQSLFTVSLERSYKIWGGEYNYMLLETLLHYTKDLNDIIQYKTKFTFRGNMTPQDSPIFFVGGNASLIGYHKDEFWGRKVFTYQNHFELKPFPNVEFSVKSAEFRQPSILFQFDIGQVRGAGNIEGLRTQSEDIIIGYGIGFGFNTDHPYMDNTDLRILIASPQDNLSDIKFYAGFGGWLQ